jgi:hypothetical protein
MKLLGMRSVAVVSAAGAYLMCAWSAAADPQSRSVWDRTYVHEGRWDGQWPCLAAEHDVVVANGRFSIPWDIEVSDQPITVAHITGVVRPSGLTENVAVAFVEPFPARVLKALEDTNHSIDEVRSRKLKVKFEEIGSDARTIIVRAEDGWCTAKWTAHRSTYLITAPTGSVDCTAAANAAEMWSAKRVYYAGELVRSATPGQPTRLYRCTDDCQAGVQPTAPWRWAFFAECAGESTREEPLPARGAAKWDTSYAYQGGAREDWRCPRGLEAFKVSKGRFSLPWDLATFHEDVRHGDDVNVGRIEGVIAADGSVKLRAKFTVDKVPPEVIESLRISAEAAMASLRTIVPAMTFALESGRQNLAGQGRRATLTVGGNACEYYFESTDYRQPSRREEDGWRIACDADQVWQSKITYNNDDRVTVKIGGARRQYRCTSSPHCDEGSRPANSPQWEKVGRCE